MKKGFVYIYLVGEYKKKYVLSSYENKIIKFGITENLIWRVADYLDKYPIGGFAKIAKCHDIIRCENEIKKLFNRAEYIPFTKQKLNKIKRIIEKFPTIDMDAKTIQLIARGDYYKSKIRQKNG